MAAAAGTPAGAAQPQYLFKVINQEIKNTINKLRSSINSGNEQPENTAVIQAIQKLENLDKNITNAITRQGETSRNNNYGIDQNEKSNAYDFLINPATTSDDGVRTATLKDKSTREINLTHLDNAITLDNNGVITTPNALQPDYKPEEFDLSTEENRNLLQSRLINCQYLEILYLTKHDELMKIFQFTLNLYDKYTYAIKILLFVLKNLLDQGPSPPREPPQPGEPHPPIQPPGTTQAPKIRLPKALITNIKQLLKDQKQVQDVIEKMKTAVDDTVPNLVNSNMANAVKDLPTGNLMDETTPT